MNKTFINARIPIKLKKRIDNHVKTNIAPNYTITSFLIEACTFYLDFEEKEGIKFSQIIKEWIDERLEDPQFQKLLFNAMKQSFSSDTINLSVEKILENPDNLERLLKMSKAYAKDKQK